MFYFVGVFDCMTDATFSPAQFASLARYGWNRIPGCERCHRKIPKPAEDRTLIATQGKTDRKMSKIEI
jgi:hypothetical protein